MPSKSGEDRALRLTFTDPPTPQGSPRTPHFSRCSWRPSPTDPAAANQHHRFMPPRTRRGGEDAARSSPPSSSLSPSLLCLSRVWCHRPRLLAAAISSNSPTSSPSPVPSQSPSSLLAFAILVVFPKKEPLRSKVGMGDGIAMAHQAQAIISNIEFLIWSE
nr:hypothetical protein Iba_chr15aCG12970 [Ipomoea batatas]